MPDTAVRPSRNAQVDTRGVGDKGLVKLLALASVPVMMSQHQVKVLLGEELFADDIGSSDYSFGWMLLSVSIGATMPCI